MKIRLAILEKDPDYLDRLTLVFGNQYADKLEIYSFTKEAVLRENLQKNKIDVLIVNEAFDIDPHILPKRCGFAFLVESADVLTYKNQPAICKYQMAERIYKRVLGLFSETVARSAGYTFGAERMATIIAFVSASGGVGSSTMAAACARNFTEKGRKTLYLNLEQLGSADTFFSAQGGSSLGDLIPAIQENHAGLGMKLESEVGQDASGVYFYHSPTDALGIQQFGPDEIDHLLTALKKNAYDYIILDTDFSLHAASVEIFKHSALILFVLDGSLVANQKLAKAYRALEKLEDQLDIPLLAKIAVIYNKFSNKTGKTFSEFSIKELSGAPTFKYANPSQVLEQLSKMNLFEKLAKVFERKK